MKHDTCISCGNLVKHFKKHPISKVTLYCYDCVQAKYQCLGIVQINGDRFRQCDTYCLNNGCYKHAYLNKKSEKYCLIRLIDKLPYTNIKIKKFICKDCRQVIYLRNEYNEDYNIPHCGQCVKYVCGTVDCCDYCEKLCKDCSKERGKISKIDYL